MKIPMKYFIFLFALVISIYSVNCEARQPVDHRTSEQKAIDHELYVRNSELSIDRDCKPKSTYQSMLLKTYSQDAVKEFWRGQTYAIERTHQKRLEAFALNEYQDSLDKQIQAIQEKKDEAYWSAQGIKQRSDPKFNESLSRADATIARSRAVRLKSENDWYERCSKYAAQQAR
jgi:hypothetical protein